MSSYEADVYSCIHSFIYSFIHLFSGGLFFSSSTYNVFDTKDKRINGAFFFFRATPAAYGGSQARSPIGAVAAGLQHSHSNTRSETHLRAIPQLMVTPDP